MLKKKLRDLKEDVYLANLELLDKGLAVYTFGDVSGIDRESGLVAAKPAGVDYIDLSPEEMVLVDLDGNLVEGDQRPSSDIMTHLFLYREFKDIGGIAHAHSLYATTWAQALRPLACYGVTQANYFLGEIPCTDIVPDELIGEKYEVEIARLIVREFDRRGLEPMKMRAVLVGAHGPFTWGKDPDEAVFLSIVLEEIAKLNYLTVTLKPEVSQINSKLIDKHFVRREEENRSVEDRGSILKRRRQKRREERRERREKRGKIDTEDE